MSKNKIKTIIAAGVLVVTMLLASATPAFASQNSKEASFMVQRWKPTAIYAAKRYQVYSSFIVTKSLHISAGENGGGEHSSTSRSCIGLFQFDGGWIHSYFGKHFRASPYAHTLVASGYNHVKRVNGKLYWNNHPHDWRQCGTCSMVRFMKVRNQGGLAAIRSHWRATYY